MTAQILVLVFGGWLIAVGMLMLARPKKAIDLLAKAASTNLINYSEITLRLIAGGALVVGADQSKAPEVFHVAGWFIVVSSLILYLVPRRWHAKYAIWWSMTLSPLFVRITSPISLLVGAALIYAGI